MNKLLSILIFNTILLSAKDVNIIHTQEDPYYFKLKKKCHGSSCCLASWKNIVSAKAKAINRDTDSCPAGYHMNMLKCIDSYTWREKNRDKNKR